MKECGWKLVRVTILLLVAGVAPLSFTWAQLTNRPSLQTPPMPIDAAFPRKSPVESFRELLAMPRAERVQALSNRPPETQKQIMAKLREYETLKPEQRELRFNATELRWYLLPLMRGPSTNRAEQLQNIPEPQRSLVTSRIREWDLLPPQTRQELLNNEATLHYFTELDSGQAPPPNPARQSRVDQGIANWKTLSEEKRREIVLQFNKFFSLTSEEKERAMRNVSDAERKQIQKALKAYESLPEQQRLQCIRSYEKFANMSPEERQEFLKNAERWQLLSAEERQSWRELVSRLSSQPPLPNATPGISSAAKIRRRMNIATPPLPFSITNTQAGAAGAR